MTNNLMVPDTTLSATSTGSNRTKVALKKGRGLMDWVRLGHTNTDLADTKGKQLKVTLEELSKHNKRDDAWMALKGQVYNVTPYFEYHPGGEDELLRGVGIDATDLFNEVHKWVNYTSMLAKCLVGPLVDTPLPFAKPIFLPLRKLINAVNPKKEGQEEIINDYYDNLKPPPSSTLSLQRTSPTLEPITDNNSLSESPSSFKNLLISSTRKCISPVKYSLLSSPPPKYDWFQTKSLINITVYTKWKDMIKSRVVVINNRSTVKVLSYIEDQVYTIHIQLLKEVFENFEVNVGNNGKVDIQLTKAKEGRWSSIGKPLKDNGIFLALSNQEIEYINCELTEKSQFNSSTYLYVFRLPDHVYMPVPIGYHVYLKLPDLDIVKPYTPVVTNFRFYKEDDRENEQLIQLFVKVYDDGCFTPLLNKVQNGATVEVSLPQGVFTTDLLKKATCNASHLALLAAGTGITPMIKLLIKSILIEGTKTILLAFNRTEDDIPWRADFEAMTNENQNIFRVHHILSSPSESWKGKCGHVSLSLLDELLPISDGEKEAFICLCGPTAFNKMSLSHLEELGYQDENIHVFAG